MDEDIKSQKFAHGTSDDLDYNQISKDQGGVQGYPIDKPVVRPKPPLPKKPDLLLKPNIICPKPGPCSGKQENIVREKNKVATKLGPKDETPFSKNLRLQQTKEVDESQPFKIDDYSDIKQSFYVEGESQGDKPKLIETFNEYGNEEHLVNNVSEKNLKNSTDPGFEVIEERENKTDDNFTKDIDPVHLDSHLPNAAGLSPDLAVNFSTNSCNLENDCNSKNDSSSQQDLRHNTSSSNSNDTSESGAITCSHTQQTSVTTKQKPLRPPPPPPPSGKIVKPQFIENTTGGDQRETGHDAVGQSLGSPENEYSIPEIKHKNTASNKLTSGTLNEGKLMKDAGCTQDPGQIKTRVVIGPQYSVPDVNEKGSSSIDQNDGKIEKSHIGKGNIFLLEDHKAKQQRNQLIHKKPTSGILETTGDSNDKKIIDKPNRYQIPFVKRQNKAYLREKKDERKSCPPPEVTTHEAREEIQEKLESKWKSKSFTIEKEKDNWDPQASKPELLQRLQELRKRSDNVGNGEKTYSMQKKLTTIKDDIDEEMEDAVFFDYVLVVKLRQTDNGLEPHISFRFPPKQKYDKEMDPRVASIPQFCFPDLENGMSVANYQEHHVGFATSETFSFVLTDMVGQRHFGYCRQIQMKGKTTGVSTPSLPEVYCIVSPYGLFGLYSQILDEVERQCTFSSSSVFVFLKAVLSHSLPKAGGSIKVSFYSGESGGLKSIDLRRDGDAAIHEHVNLSCLFEKLPVAVILNIVSALLLERRIILASSQLSLLSACSHGFVSLLYPFTWQHTYIPVLPYNLVDMCCLPTPYLLGILSGCLENIEDLPIDEAIIVDLDSGMILRDVDDESSCPFPTQIKNQIDSDLSQVAKVSTVHTNGSKEKNMMITQIFIDAYLALIGHFTGYFSTMGDDVFQSTDFYRACKSKETKRFLKAFVKTQAFQEFTLQYINESLKGQGLFETKLRDWQNSRKSKGTESAWHKFKGKLKAGHR